MSRQPWYCPPTCGTWPCCTYGRWPRWIPKMSTLPNPPCSRHIPCCSLTPSPALLLHLPAAAPGQGNTGGGMCGCGVTVALHSVILSLSLSSGQPGSGADTQALCSLLSSPAPNPAAPRHKGGTVPHCHHARAGSWGRSWQLCGILVCLPPSPLLLFVFTVQWLTTRFLKLAVTPAASAKSRQSH